MATRRRSMLEHAETENFWPSFTDLVSTVSLILFVLLLLAYTQNLIAGKNLAHLQAKLAGNHARLAESRKKILSSEQKLRALQREIAGSQAQLAQFSETMAEQRTVIANSHRELGELRQKLEGIVVLRLSVLEKVKQAIEAELRSGNAGRVPPVSIADNGNIVIDESVLFEFDSYRVTDDGKRFLGTVAQAFANVLADPSVRGYIDVVLVQGHTDERGDEAYNRELSARRAGAVLGYMFEANTALARAYGGYFAASAYSEFRPISAEHSPEAYRRNRRIELSVVLKDATVREAIDEYLRQAAPSEPAVDGAASP